MNIPLNLISPKSLEKQLKVVESRIGVLETEISELLKIKAACLVLLGTAPPAETVDAAPTAGNAKGKKKRSESNDEDFAADPIDENEVAEESEEGATVN